MCNFRQSSYFKEILKLTEVATHKNYSMKSFSHCQVITAEKLSKCAFNVPGYHQHG